MPGALTTASRLACSRSSTLLKWGSAANEFNRTIKMSHTYIRLYEHR